MVKDESLWSLIQTVPKRLVELIIKNLSMKGEALALTTWLLFEDKISTWGFLAVVGMVLFDRAFLKHMEKLKE